MSTPETTTTAPTAGFKQPVIIPMAMTSTGCCGAPATDGGACCGEPVQAVTDGTANGTASCCGDTSASGGGCCN